MIKKRTIFLKWRILFISVFSSLLFFSTSLTSLWLVFLPHYFPSSSPFLFHSPFSPLLIFLAFPFTSWNQEALYVLLTALEHLVKWQNLLIYVWKSIFFFFLCSSFSHFSHLSLSIPPFYSPFFFWFHFPQSAFLSFCLFSLVQFSLSCRGV